MDITKTATDPKSGKQVADILFEIITKVCDDANYTLHPNCYVQFLTGDDGEGDNETSFYACLVKSSWSKAEAELKYTADQHGRLSIEFQKKIDTSTEISLHAFAAAGHIVRAKCTLKCNGKGQWCTWP